MTALSTESLEGTVKRSLEWLESMLPEPDGRSGVWERLRLVPDGTRVDHVVYRVRPDSTSETALLFLRAGARFDDERWYAIGRSLSSYLLTTGLGDGTFPFFREVIPPGERSIERSETWDLIYPNDHGKLLEHLCLIDEFLDDDVVRRTAQGVADALVRGQSADGWFALGGHAYTEPCYTAWAAVGLARWHQSSGDEAAAVAARRAVDYLVALQLDDGRIRTSYELTGTEAWRPASSETVETLRALARLQIATGEDQSSATAGAVAFIDRLTTADGAIRNCDEHCADAALQNDPDLADIVYTEAYALHAWLDLSDAQPDQGHIERAALLADFLTSIQCEGENPRWDGAWRGSFDVVQRRWRGRSDQRNDIDEGGALSVYTGWATTTIANGILRLLETADR